VRCGFDGTRRHAGGSDPPENAQIVLRRESSWRRGLPGGSGAAWLPSAAAVLHKRDVVWLPSGITVVPFGCHRVSFGCHVRSVLPGLPSVWSRLAAIECRLAARGSRCCLGCRQCGLVWLPSDVVWLPASPATRTDSVIRQPSVRCHGSHQEPCVMRRPPSASRCLAVIL
jgi:hypothetical protein